MPMISGKYRDPAPTVFANGPLDSSLPQYRRMQPSVFWNLASRVPLVVAALIAVVLVADRLGMLPKWLH